VKILHIDKQKKRISLSITKAENDAETVECHDYMSNQEESQATLGDEVGDVLKKL
jgi:4-hydroxy-3-methylbut-2-enyl diphosphate reductase